MKKPTRLFIEEKTMQSLTVNVDGGKLRKLCKIPKGYRLVDCVPDADFNTPNGEDVDFRLEFRKTTYGKIGKAR